MRRAPTLASTGAAAVVSLAAAPAPASAHGLVGRADLPIPDWLFSWGAATVLIVSFLALAAAWTRPKLQAPAWRPLPAGLDRVLSSRAVTVLCGAIGVALLAVTIWAGLFGTEATPENFAPTFVYVGFWLGLVPLSVLFGDVFRAFNPWCAMGRATGALARRLGGGTSEPLPYPTWLGYWPAAAGLLAFGWFELVSPRGDEPLVVAVLALIYTGVTLAAMAIYGVERWSERGEAFSVYFGLFARLSVFERRDGHLGVRPPLSGLPRWPVAPGAVALLATMIGVVTFDGLSAGQSFYEGMRGPLGWLRDSVGLSPRTALQAVFALTMFATVLLVAGFYWLGIRGARTVAREFSTSGLARSFAHTLVPIALAYVGAHYVSLLLLQGQALGALASDPLGRGWDLLGSADSEINYGLLGAETFWYLQVGFVVIGHVAALVLAHDRALAIFDDAKAAVRSQYWLLTVMVGFTTLALWLLAQAREG